MGRRRARRGSHRHLRVDEERRGQALLGEGDGEVGAGERGEELMALDSAKLDAFMGKAVVDLGATLHAALVVMGDRLGIYKAMAGAGPLSPAELAERTGLRERYLREWMAAQAAGGYPEYHPENARVLLPDEQAFGL